MMAFDPKNGFPLFGSIRMVSFSINSMARQYYNAIKIYGFEKAYEVMTEYAYEDGMAVALNIIDQFAFETTEEALKAGEVLFVMSGWANIKIKKISLDMEKKTLQFSGVWHDSVEAVIWNTKDSFSEGPICNITSSLISGYASAIMGQEVLVQELSCQTQGHEFCSFEGRTLAEWGLEANTMKKYFSVSNLGEELIRLQTALAEANEDLARRNAEIQLLRQQPEVVESGEEIISRSDAMIKLQLQAKKVAPTKATVLIQGESGTGKEVLARFIHRHSENKEKAFLSINCAALPPSLIESELFGHVKGAFTGADRDKKGLFVEAGEGTIFLNEIGELPLDVQAKLLSALQDREVRPVGGLKSIPVQARIITATNRDLKEMIAESRFREDLYYRLAVFPLLVPPLRERRQDILLLARHFLLRKRQNHPGLSPQAVRCLETYTWPGNVRELENWIEHAVILAGNERILPEHFHVVMTPPGQAPLTVLSADLPTYEVLERRYVQMVLDHTGNNKSAAARILGIGFSTLWRKLKRDKA